MAELTITGNPPLAVGGEPYGPFGFSVSGGTPPYTVSITGQLPLGLSATAAGVVSGTAAIPPNCLNDYGGAILWVVLTPSKDGGDSRANKQWGDLMLDYSTFQGAAKPILQVFYDDLLVQGVNPRLPIQSQRGQQIIDLIALPQEATDEPIIHRNMANLLYGCGPVYLYEWQPSYTPLPEDTTARVSEWQIAGTPHYKFVQGLRLHADTNGLNKQIQIEYDGISGPILTINHNGQLIIPYSWPTPFKAHMMRIVPLDDVPWRYWPDTDWVFEIEPEPANYWISQPTDLGQAGYLHARELWLAFAAAMAGGVVSVIVDGVLTTIATLAQALSPVKNYYPCPPLKGRYWQLTASGTGLQIYERDVEFLVKSWGSTGAYSRVKPFGDLSGGGGVSGAKI